MLFKHFTPLKLQLSFLLLLLHTEVLSMTRDSNFAFCLETAVQKHFYPAFMTFQELQSHSLQVTTWTAVLMKQNEIE